MKNLPVHHANHRQTSIWISTSHFSFCTDWSGQTVLTQIKLLKSDQALHCLPFCLHLLKSYSMVKSYCSKFKIITMFWVSEKFLVFYSIQFYSIPTNNKLYILVFGTDLWYNPCQKVHALSVHQPADHHNSHCKHREKDKVSHVTRKPVFRVCDQVGLNTSCSATETS